MIGINWGDPGNWSDDRVPTQNDAVTIGLGYSSIQVASGTYSVYSITSQSPVEITTGTLVLYGPATFSSGPMTVNGAGTLQVGSGTSTGSFAGGIIDNGSVLIDASSPLNFAANVSGNGTVTLNGPGIVTLTGANTYFGQTTISDGGLVIGSASALPTGNTIVDNATLTILAGTSSSPVIAGNISGSGVLTVGSVATPAYLRLASGTGTSQQSGLVVVSGSTLDVTSNSFDVHYAGGSDPFSTIRGYIIGGQVTSSLDNSSHAVGYADGADGIVSGLASGDILLRWTFKGDATLDGTVNFADLVKLAQNYNKSGTTWDTGDFEGTGTTNFADLVDLAQNYNKNLSGSAQPAATFAADWQRAQSIASPVGPAAKLLFSRPPANQSSAGSGLGTLTVRVQDASGRPVARDESTVKHAVASGPKDGKLRGILFAKVVNGIGTINDL